MKAKKMKQDKDKRKYATLIWVVGFNQRGVPGEDKCLLQDRDIFLLAGIPVLSKNQNSLYELMEDFEDEQTNQTNTKQAAPQSVR